MPIRNPLNTNCGGGSSGSDGGSGPGGSGPGGSGPGYWTGYTEYTIGPSGFGVTFLINLLFYYADQVSFSQSSLDIEYVNILTSDSPDVYRGDISVTKPLTCDEVLNCLIAAWHCFNSVVKGVKCVRTPVTVDINLMTGKVQFVLTCYKFYKTVKK